MADPQAQSESESPSRRDQRIELIAAVILSVTTVLTAWTAFESSQWSGVQAIAFSEASAHRTESVRFSNRAGQHTALDVALFSQWAISVSEEDVAMSEFIADRFRDEFVPAHRAWIATDPLNDPDAPPSPFAMEEYRLAAAERADHHGILADQKADEAREASRVSGNYVMTTVLFAVVLFFVGVGGKFSSARVRTALMTFAGIGLVAGVAIIATFPIQL